MHSMYYIRKLTSEFECDKKLVGPIYSGASEMKHRVTGLQTNILSSYPSALFTYHYVHHKFSSLAELSSN